MEAILSFLDPDCADAGFVAEAYRLAHSIKGATATFGFEEMTELSRALAGALDRARSGKIDLSAPLIAACCDARRTLSEQMVARRDGRPVSLKSGRHVCANLAALAMPPQDVSELRIPEADGVCLTVFDLRFTISRAVVSSDSLVDALIEHLAALGTLAVVMRPQGGGAAGEWRIGLRSAASEGEVRKVLDLLVEPGSLWVGRRGEERGTVAPPRLKQDDLATLNQPEEAGESRLTRDRMAVLARQIRESSAQITSLAGQMEAISARHAVLLEESAELGRRLALEVQQSGALLNPAKGAIEIPGEGGAAAGIHASIGSEQGVATARNRPAVRSPLPKVKRSSPARLDLAEEWEEC
jgi:hypothetical protein